MKLACLLGHHDWSSERDEGGCWRCRHCAARLEASTKGALLSGAIDGICLGGMIGGAGIAIAGAVASAWWMIFGIAIFAIHGIVYVKVRE